MKGSDFITFSFEAHLQENHYAYYKNEIAPQNSATVLICDTHGIDLVKPVRKWVVKHTRGLKNSKLFTGESSEIKYA